MCFFAKIINLQDLSLKIKSLEKSRPSIYIFESKFLKLVFSSMILLSSATGTLS